MKDKCPFCNGTGVIIERRPHYETATTEMAIDACDRSLEGETIQWGFDEWEEPCPHCNINEKTMGISNEK